MIIAVVVVIGILVGIVEVTHDYKWRKRK